MECCKCVGYLIKIMFRGNNKIYSVSQISRFPTVDMYSVKRTWVIWNEETYFEYNL